MAEELESAEILDGALTLLAKQMPFPEGCERWTESITHWREWAIKEAKEHVTNNR